MYSALSGKLVRSNIAMTGEVTLRGDVLPVGGIREKILAAKRYGIKKVLLPKENRIEAAEMPRWVLKGLELVFVGDLMEVFEKVIGECETDGQG
jgi:ATP-dependent Lon protease